MPLLSASFCEMSHGPMPKTLIDINQLKDRKSRAQQHSSHLSQQWRGYSELRQKIRAKPQPMPRTAALMTARLAILSHQSFSQKKKKPTTIFPRVFTLVTDLALKAQPASACSTVMAAVVFKSQTCSKTSCLLSVCGSKTEAQNWSTGINKSITRPLCFCCFQACTTTSLHPSCPSFPGGRKLLMCLGHLSSTNGNNS